MNKLILIFPALGLIFWAWSMARVADKPTPKNATEDEEVGPYLLTGVELDRAEEVAKRGARF